LRRTFTDVATQIIKTNDNSALLLGDIGVYGFNQILTDFPKRVFNIGILEQSMVSVGAGLSSEGIIPIIHTIAPFIVERALEQIKIDFGYQNLPGNFVSVGASFDYAKLGCTHHCPGDVNILSNVPGVNIFLPGHNNEFESQLRSQWNSGNLNYFRISEHANQEAIAIKFGEIKKIKNGTKGVVIVVGPFLSEAFNGLSDLDIEIHYLNSISAGDDMKVESEFPGNKVVIYEPYYSGAVLLKLNDQISSNHCEVMQLGVNKRFLEEYGSYQEHLISLGLDADSLKRRVEVFINS
jgi:transketolase